MRRGTLSASLLTLLALVSLCLQSAVAQPPDLLRSYRFVPRLSTLHQTGGFAGFDFRMPIYGTYDFVTGYLSGDGPLPFFKPYAQFTNVEALAAHPLLDPGLYLDVALNLSGLDGVPVLQGPHGLEVFRFSGDDGQGAKVNLHVATLGRWMFMRGGTEPPCCDFFEYDIKAISRQIPSGDFNDDGDVTATDLAVWQSGYDAAGSLLHGRDFLSWQRSYGETAPSVGEFEAMLDAALAATSTAEVATVPEPAGLMLIVGFAMALGTRRRLR